MNNVYLHTQNHIKQYQVLPKKFSGKTRYKDSQTMLSYWVPPKLIYTDHYDL
jgi:hypothetical protein